MEDTPKCHIALLVSVARTIDAFFADWVDAWQAAEIDVTTLSNGNPQTVSAAHREIRNLRRRPGLLTLPAILELREALIALSPDVILTSTASCSGVVRLTSVSQPIVYFVHGLHWSGIGAASGAAWKVLEQALIPRTAGFISINSDDTKWLAERVPASRVLYLRGGVGLDLSRWRAVERRPIPGRVLVVGDLIPRKQPLEAVRILSLLRRIAPSATLHFVGDGPLRGEAALLARQLGCESQTFFHGHVADVRPYLSTADVVFHGSAWEGLPRALLEAVAARVPVVAYNAKGTRDVPDVEIVRAGAREEAATALALKMESVSGSPQAHLGEEYDSHSCAKRTADRIRQWI